MSPRTIGGPGHDAPCEVPDGFSAYLRELGARGGRARSPKKRRASIVSLAKARRVKAKKASASRREQAATERGKS